MNDFFGELLREKAVSSILEFYDKINAKCDVTSQKIRNPPQMMNQIDIFVFVSEHFSMLREILVNFIKMF